MPDCLQPPSPPTTAPDRSAELQTGGSDLEPGPDSAWQSTGPAPRVQPFSSGLDQRPSNPDLLLIPSSFPIQVNKHVSFLLTGSTPHLSEEEEGQLPANKALLGEGHAMGTCT